MGPIGHQGCLWRGWTDSQCNAITSAWLPSGFLSGPSWMASLSRRFSEPHPIPPVSAFLPGLPAHLASVPLSLQPGQRTETVHQECVRSRAWATVSIPSKHVCGNHLGNLRSRFPRITWVPLVTCTLPTLHLVCVCWLNVYLCSQDAQVPSKL